MQKGLGFYFLSQEWVPGSPGGRREDQALERDRPCLTPECFLTNCPVITSSSESAPSCRGQTVPIHWTLGPCGNAYAVNAFGDVRAGHLSCYRDLNGYFYQSNAVQEALVSRAYLCPLPVHLDESGPV